MISDKMVKVLSEIKKSQNNIGVAKAPEISTYADKASKYRSLEKMEKLDLIQSHPAPKKEKLEKTYTLQPFGERLLDKAENLEKNFRVDK